MNISNASMGKAISIPQSHQSSAVIGYPTSSFESSRRSNSSSFPNQPVPKKGQGSRKQHRNQRRPVLGGLSNAFLDDQDQMAEIRAVRNPSSRRGQTSITHLLEYTAPRPYRDHNNSGRSYRRSTTWGPGVGHHAADKQRYVHANYRFVIVPDGDFSRHASEADIYLDWTNVLQVIASSLSQTASCPICLSEPVAPRMAKCGHIFCLPCLLRFMSATLSEDESKTSKGPRWKRCPICEDTVYMHEAKPVRFYAGQESALPRPGDDVILRLMVRNAKSTLALPKEGGQEIINSGTEIPWHTAANALDYARIMKATGDYLASQHDEEIKALLQQEEEDEMMFNLDSEWTQKAVRAINTSKEKILSSKTSDTVTSCNRGARISQEPNFYFYSAPPHLYLSPLDIRILKTKFGSFASFPSTLLPTVEHIRSQVVDHEIRKRHRYLAHLPLGCVISFLECDWTDIVPEETLEGFREEIERRRKDHREKAAQEERERIQAERLQAAEMRANAGRRTDLLDEERAPTMDPSEFVPLAGFSQKSSPEPRPGFETLASMSTSPSTQRTVWGTRAVQQSPEITPTRDSSHDGWLRDEEVFTAADMTPQLNTIEAQGNVEVDGEHNMNTASTNATSSKGAGGRKKKKKQKITLMSTGGRRGN